MDKFKYTRLNTELKKPFDLTNAVHLTIVAIASIPLTCLMIIAAFWFFKL